MDAHPNITHVRKYNRRKRLIQRQRPFNVAELTAIVNGIIKRRRVILQTRIPGSVFNAKKTKAWDEICREVNKVSRGNRKTCDVKKKWQSYKHETKRRDCLIRKLQEAGEVNSRVRPLSDIEKKILEMNFLDPTEEGVITDDADECEETSSTSNVEHAPIVQPLGQKYNADHQYCSVDDMPTYLVPSPRPESEAIDEELHPVEQSNSANAETMNRMVDREVLALESLQSYRKDMLAIEKDKLSLEKQRLVVERRRCYAMEELVEIERRKVHLLKTVLSKTNSTSPNKNNAATVRKEALGLLL